MTKVNVRSVDRGVRNVKCFHRSTCETRKLFTGSWGHWVLGRQTPAATAVRRRLRCKQSQLHGRAPTQKHLALKRTLNRLTFVNGSMLKNSTSSAGRTDEQFGTLTKCYNESMRQRTTCNDLKICTIRFETARKLLMINR